MQHHPCPSLGESLICFEMTVMQERIRSFVCISEGVLTSRSLVARDLVCVRRHDLLFVDNNCAVC
jgi:hypothetical protein